MNGGKPMFGCSRTTTRFRDAVAGFASISRRMPAAKTGVPTGVRSTFIVPKPQPPMQCSEEKRTGEDISPVGNKEQQSLANFPFCVVAKSNGLERPPTASRRTRDASLISRLVSQRHSLALAGPEGCRAALSGTALPREPMAGSGSFHTLTRRASAKPSRPF